jgi:hypothetical protein
LLVIVKYINDARSHVRKTETYIYKNDITHQPFHKITITCQELFLLSSRHLKRVTSQAVTRQPLTQKTRDRSQICAVLRGIFKGSSPSTSAVSSHYHFVSAPYTFFIFYHRRRMTSEIDSDIIQNFSYQRISLLKITRVTVHYKGNMEGRSRNHCRCGKAISIIYCNKLNKQSRTADEGWSSSLGIGRGANNPPRENAC